MLFDKLDSLDGDSLQRVTGIFDADLSDTGIIHIGRAGYQNLFPRVLHLVKDPALRRLPAALPHERALENVQPA